MNALSYIAMHMTLVLFLCSLSTFLVKYFSYKLIKHVTIVLIRWAWEWNQLKIYYIYIHNVYGVSEWWTFLTCIDSVPIKFAITCIFRIWLWPFIENTPGFVIYYGCHKPCRKASSARHHNGMCNYNFIPGACNLSP